MVFFKEDSKRKWIFRGAVVISVGLVVLFLVNFSSDVSAVGRLEARADIKYYYNVIGEDPVVALTFDDGPDPVKTRQIMDVLQKHGAPATFFFTGSSALRYPEVVEEVYDAGFGIGNHTFTHSDKVHSSERRLKLELNLTNEIVEYITGEPTKLYRPPYLIDIGSDPLPDLETPSAPLAWALRNGYIPIGVDVDSKDWEANSVQDIVNGFMEKLPGGHIALFHDGADAQYTAEALDLIIAELESRGYRIVTLEEVVGLNFERQALVSRDLRRGMSDENAAGEVSALQTFLLKEGDFGYEVTGYFDSVTENALVKWQARSGIVGESGYVGQLTEEKIKQSLASNGYPVQPKSSLFQFPVLEERLQHFSVFSSSVLGKGLVFISTAVLVFAALRIIAVLGLSLVAAGKRRRVRAPYKERVSVVVPAYNEEENIGATLESIVGNGDIVREIIVINDGSDDRTPQVVDSVRRKYPHKIRLIRTRNGGKARALNIGLRETVSDVVVTTDADSIFDSGAVGRLVAHFSNPRVAAVAGKVVVTDSDRLLNVLQHVEYAVGQNLDKRAFSCLNAVQVVPGPIGAWRKNDLYAAGGYSADTLVEDQDLTLAMLAAGKKVVYEPTALSYTETPHTVKDFVKQRFRWIFGTVQCAWKYKGYLFSLRALSLGWVVLPHTLIFGVLLPLMYPVMSALFAMSFMLDFLREVLAVYLVFMMFDFAYAGCGFIGERKKLYSLGLVPLQRMFYRVVIYFVLIQSVIKAVEGTEALWNKVRKKGEAHNLHWQMEGDGTR